VLFDILTIRFLLKYFTRPMHFFGGFGLFGTATGGAILGFCAIEKIIWNGDIVLEHGPLMVAGSLLFVTGMMMFSTGLIGELMIRTYFESQGRRIYAIRDVLTQKRRNVISEP